ncbi:hypothetical protein [Clostridium pasteurianum]|uniref:Uncharacterized protein n=1 Tax=Clostridium pasteurianum BC1 TaxID=86416 RepID=R4KCD7_CLOPA|nr:hypothetical protein [Clostridium pasteurianum]AGK98194.1 hypothetical protein Clopa_3399 [Clostridium pasteurianum BC1]
MKITAKKKKQVINLKKEGKSYKDIFLIARVRFENARKIIKEAGVK